MKAYPKALQGAVLCLLLLLSCSVIAQPSAKCGFDYTLHAVINTHPSLADTLNKVRNGEYGLVRSAAKGTAWADTPVIPVVFHVILTRLQLIGIGDTQGLLRRIDSQMTVLNRDFNAGNADSIDIPGAFKPLFGHSGIRFALAHTRPDGTATPGYELVITTENGINIERGYGSGFGFSSAKYKAGGGADAWDTDSYLNVWVINPLEDNATSNILGLAIPAYIATEEYNISTAERGVVMHYRAFGKRAGPGDSYVTGSDLGRTLVHEVGHFFNLLHIWGDDEGKCPDNRGLDDGIADTPPQAYSSSGCFTFPKTDGCSRNAPGIMYMNYMDYSMDRCLLLFTHGQVARMRDALAPGNDAYSLTQRPWLLQYPDAAKPAEKNDYTVYPNPADDWVNVTFRKQAEGLKSIHMVDIAGRVVASREYQRQSSFFSFYVGALQTGMYFMVLNFEEGKKVEKVFVR